MQKIYTRKFIAVFLLYMAFAGLASCGGGNDPSPVDGVPGQVTQLTAEGSYGMVSLSWRVPADEFFYYAKLEYLHPVTGSAVEEYITKFSADQDGYCRTVIEGYPDTGQYDYTVTAYSYRHTPSMPSTVSCRPLESPVNSVMNSLTVTPDVMGALLAWENPTGIPVRIVATYTDYYGEPATLSIVSDSDGQARAGCFDPSDPNLSVIVYDNAGTTASERRNYSDIEVLAEENLNSTRAGWTVLDCNDTPLNPDMGPECLLNDDFNSIWHTSVFCDWPVTAVYDMGAEMVLTNIGLYRRRNEQHGPGSVMIELSADGSTWHEAAVFDFDNFEDGRQSFYLRQNIVSARYLRLSMLTGSGEVFAYLAIMEAGGKVRQ